MADAVQHAINDSRRVPNMVLTAHVHNYQRIERNIVTGAQTPFLVLGLGGYFHLHGMNAENGAEDPNTHAKLVAGNHTNHGYATLTVDAEKISGIVTTVDGRKKKGEPQADTFSYPAKALHLTKNAIVSL